MSDVPNEATNNTEEQFPTFSIQKLYVKDASLESPNTPACFLGSETEPTFDVKFRNETRQFDNGFFEASLTVTAKAQLGADTLFLVEITQAGVFHISNLPEADLEGALGIGCPTILFPYLREAVSDMITRAGFPPLVLQPINFEAIYLQQKAANQEAVTPATEETDANKKAKKSTKTTH